MASSSAEPHTILILGSSFAGLSIAHYLLKHILPSLPSSTHYTITMLSPSPTFYSKVPSPRTVVRPDLIPPERLFADIPSGFSSYAPSSFTYVRGWARGIDPSSRTVSVEYLDSTGASTETKPLSYDTLVIATGASSPDPIWSPINPQPAELRAAFASRSAALKAASSILVAGGGPVGVETAGELGTEYGSAKSITLLSGSTRLLPGVKKAGLGAAAEGYLTAMGVRVEHDNLRVTSHTAQPDGKTLLALSDGSTRLVDVYLDATGLHASTSFIPPEWLAPNSTISVTPYLRVAHPSAGPRVYALGSAASYSRGTIPDILDSVPALAAIMEWDLSGGAVGTETPFQRQEKEIMIVPVGRNKGVGVVFDWWFPSLLVWLVKGRTFFVENTPKYVDGSLWKKRK